MEKFEYSSAVTGFGMSEVGRRLMRDPLALTIDASLAAIEDAGLTRDDIDGVFFMYDSEGTNLVASPNWYMVSASDSNRTETVTATAVVEDAWIKLRIEVNSAGTSAEFFIDGASVGSLSTNLPTNAGDFHSFSSFTIIKSNGTSDRIMYIDYAAFKDTPLNER